MAALQEFLARLDKRVADFKEQAPRYEDCEGLTAGDWEEQWDAFSIAHQIGES